MKTPLKLRFEMSILKLIKSKIFTKCRSEFWSDKHAENLIKTYNFRNMYNCVIYEFAPYE